MKKKWKILLACVVVLAGIAAWCLVPRSAVGEDLKIHYVEAYYESEYYVADVTDQVGLEALMTCCGTQSAWDTTWDMTAGVGCGMSRFWV